MKNKTIYLDNHATTLVDPRVLKAMLPYFKEKFGNASSGTHRFGREASAAVERARSEVARLLNADPKEIIFTSGATESNNLALKGAAEACREKGRHLITVATEHKSALDPLRRLELSGFRVSVLPVKPDGLLDLDVLRREITGETILVSVMLANNEIGAIQPLEAIGRIAREKRIAFHSDAVQALGKIPVDVKALGVDFLSISAHKMHGPKGVGALYVRKTIGVGAHGRAPLLPQMDGGAQETGMRAGTLNVPGIVGFGEACRIARVEMKRESRRLAALRDTLQKGLLVELKGAGVNGSQAHRLPNNLSLTIPGVEASALMKALPGIAFSAGSACLSTSPEPSHVLKAIGLDEASRRSTVRFGLGRFNTASEIKRAISAIASAVRRMTR